MAKKTQRAEGPRCLDCGHVVKDFEYYTHDRKRKGLICEDCGPGKPQMVKASPKKR